jgi:hypothetical protein
VSSSFQRRYEVKVVPVALAAIEKQYLYIRNKQRAPLEADRWLGRVWNAVAELETLPSRFSLAPENEFRSYPIRRMMIDNHMLLFSVDEPKRYVYVLNLRHGARLPRAAGLPKNLPQ